MSLTLQKANFWKRISAYLFDFIITVILTMGFALAVSSIIDYDKHSATLQSYYTEYETKVKEEHGLDFGMTSGDEGYDELTDAQKEILKQAQTEFGKDERVLNIYQKMMTSSIAIVGISVLLGIVTVHFIVPLFFKNGQTLGKKIFGLAVIRTNLVKASTPVLFIRAVMGLYAIETMFPIALVLMIAYGMLGSVGLITIGLLLLLQIGVLIASKNRSSIHDLLTDTVVVDLSSQRIFNTQEEMLAYKKQLHEEEVAKKEYH